MLRRVVAPFLAAVLLAARASAGQLPPLPPEPAAGAPWVFAVMGDNRGAEDGTLSPPFVRIVAALKGTQARFVVTTGDMVLGYVAREKTLRKEWATYLDAIHGLPMPVFHAPGNHDLHNAKTAKVYAELIGPTYYAFDYGGARFIALDTETVPHRVSGLQLTWLTGQLATAGDRTIFLFFHEPLYPAGPHVGSSLDVYPQERDALHALFVRYKDRIGAVFEGHEHLYDTRVLDGVRYDITGGGGAPLYVPRDKGGFNHFLLVTMTGGKPSIEVKEPSAK